MLLLRTLYRYFFFFLMILRPPRSTRTDTLFPYTTLFRSDRPEDDAGIAYPDGRLGYDRHAVAGTHEPNQVLEASEMLIDEIGRATSELQSLMRISYAVFCLKKKT